MTALASSERDDILAYRLSGHNLSLRLPPGGLLEAAGACGVQNTPPGSAALSLMARVKGLHPSYIDAALYETKDLIEAWSLRASPHLFPAAEAAVFGAALVPDDEHLADIVFGVRPALERTGMTMRQLADLIEQAVSEELDGVALPKHELAVLAVRRIVPRLTEAQRDAWALPSEYGPGMPLGEAMVRFALYLLGIRGVVCFSQHREGGSPLVLTRQWLGRSLPGEGSGDAGRELVRRYLRCYGPSTVKHFSEWAGIGAAHANKLWTRCESRMVKAPGGMKGWLLDDQVNELGASAMPQGARLLPPHDPYLQQRDRAITVPDPAQRRMLWRAIGSPGAVIVDGEIAAAWRPRKKGAALRLDVEQFRELGQKERDEVRSEAGLMAPFRGVSSVEVAFTGRPRP